MEATNDKTVDLGGLDSASAAGDAPDEVWLLTSAPVAHSCLIMTGPGLRVCKAEGGARRRLIRHATRGGGHI